MKYEKGTIMDLATGVHVMWDKIPEHVSVVRLPPGGAGTCPVECYEKVGVAVALRERLERSEAEIARLRTLLRTRDDADVVTVVLSRAVADLFLRNIAKGLHTKSHEIDLLHMALCAALAGEPR